jgi:streptogramin lyase
MALSVVLNTLQKFQVVYTLQGAAGSIDPSSPVTVTLDPPENGVVENIAINADGSLVTFDLTASVLGDTSIVVDSDANKASGVLSLKVSDIITAIESENITADAGIILPAI